MPYESFPTCFCTHLIFSISDVGLIGGSITGGTPARIMYNGVVAWYPPMETSTFCEMKIKLYPFDTQTCSVQITAWAYASIEMNLEFQ